MCLILFAYRQHTKYKLILAANRDEYFSRETASLTYWEDAPDVLAGRDLEKGGTWLGITRRGRFAAITNYRDFNRAQKETESRGLLVSEYLVGTDPPQQYLKALQMKADMYNGFNLLVGDRHTLFYFSNREMKISKLQPGLYGLSNHLLETPWPKVQRGKKLLQLEIGRNPLSTEPLLEILSDRHIPADEQLPDTGIGLEWERMLSPIFISSDHYGTRSSTLMLISQNGGISMTERTHLDQHTAVDTLISIGEEKDPTQEEYAAGCSPSSVENNQEKMTCQNPVKQ